MVDDDAADIVWHVVYDLASEVGRQEDLVARSRGGHSGCKRFEKESNYNSIWNVNATRVSLARTVDGQISSLSTDRCPSSLRAPGERVAGRRA